MVDMSEMVTAQKPRSSKRIRKAVADGLQRWQAQKDRRQAREMAAEWLAESGGQAPGLGQNGRSAAANILRAMPRRGRLISPSETPNTPLVFMPVAFEASFFQSLRRLFAWFYLFASITLGNLNDKLRKRDSLEREAQRLREGLERAGGTFVKLGQQVAMRIDLVPWEYCMELSKMLDKMPPFSLEEALAIIERTSGRPWDEIFAYFDPEPIGSASIACVYQAVLKNGAKVAVKIRRPGIGELFMADFKVLDWLFDTIEFLTIVRPGFTQNLRSEFQSTLLEELDFTKEARFQDTFRRNSGKSGLNFITAPKVYFEYSNEEVIVQEFASGMWLWELISAVENRDPAGLAMMRQLNIDPRKVAKRILWSAFWSMDENLFFHADPHPANILVRPNSKLVFIDFGSCGSFNEEQRAALERIVLTLLNNDAEGMARATLKLLEPFPPVDVASLMKEAEAEYMQVLYTFQTKKEYTEWWERTSARQWLALIRVVRNHNLSMNLHTLRMIRATLLYDTLVLRLDKTADRYEEYANFMEHRAKIVKKRWQKQMRRNLQSEFFLRIEELAETSEDLFVQAQHTLSSPILNFGSTVDKWIFAVSVLSRMAGRLLLLTMLTILLISANQYLRRQPVEVVDTLSRVFINRFYLVLTVAIVILNLRHIYFRLKDRD